MLSRLARHTSARWALGVIVVLVIAAIVGPWLDPHSARQQLDIVNLKDVPPSRVAWLGTDQYSRCVSARLLQGARVSLSVAALSVFLSMTLGTAYGLVAGYVGGRVDAIMMRILDGCLAIPRVLLLIAVLTMREHIGLAGLIVLIGVTGWFSMSRLVRAETLSMRHREFMEAARALGAPDLRMIWRHLLPNVATPVIVSATLAIGNVIALEAGLSYLGIGAQEPNASWGSIFLEGAGGPTTHWWIALFPGIAIVATVLAFNALGDALRDVLDPRQVDTGRFAAASHENLSLGAPSLQNG